MAVSSGAPEEQMNNRCEKKTTWKLQQISRRAGQASRSCGDGVGNFEDSLQHLDH